MFGVELTLAQKVSIAIMLVALGVSVVFITKAFQPEVDLHINAYYPPIRHHPMMDDDKHSGRITATNPVDPKKDEKPLEIAVVDGMLEVTQFPNDPTKHMRFKWAPERRVPVTYQYYKDPMKGVEEYSDAFRHALAFATYKLTYEVPGGLGLLGSAGMTESQAQQELAARTLMKNEITLLRTGSSIRSRWGRWRRRSRRMKRREAIRRGTRRRRKPYGRCWRQRCSSWRRHRGRRTNR
jgi:hypothetical protein